MKSYPKHLMKKGKDREDTSLSRPKKSVGSPKKVDREDQTHRQYSGRNPLINREQDKPVGKAALRLIPFQEFS